MHLASVMCARWSACASAVLGEPLLCASACTPGDTCRAGCHLCSQPLYSVLQLPRLWKWGWKCQHLALWIPVLRPLLHGAPTRCCLPLADKHRPLSLKPGSKTWTWKAVCKEHPPVTLILLWLPLNVAWVIIYYHGRRDQVVFFLFLMCKAFLDPSLPGGRLAV